MKKTLLFAMVSFGLMGIFSSCKKTAPNDTSGGNGDSLHITLSRSTVELNNFDYVQITVKDNAGNDITSSSSILLNNTTVITNKYTPISIGSCTISAKKNSMPSDSKILNVVAKTASPFTQKILLEDCTGAWCGYCPRIAYSLETYKAAHPECIVVGVHGGSSGTDPFKFQYYTTFNSKYAITGYPTAVLNRKTEWSEATSDLDVARQKWAPLGLAINSTVNGNTVSGSVKVKFNVTTDKSMKIVIALVENGLVYPQVNYYSPQYGATPYLYGGVSPITNFVHNGVLRRTATDLFGDAIDVASQIKNNTIDVPFTMPLSGVVYGGGSYSAVAAKCAIVAFVTDGSTTSNAGAYNVQYAPVGSTVNFD